MVKKVEFVIPDEIEELLRQACLNDDVKGLARTLFLKGLSCEYMSFDDDETAKKIEAWTERLENL